jgi:hypothetical protein
MLKRAKANIHHLAKPIKTALVVGTVLCLINKSFTAGNWVGISLNYLVPFLVALYSRVAYVQESRKKEGASPPAR